MISLAILEVNNRFRSVFIDHDHEDYREALIANHEATTKALDRTQRRKVDANIEKQVLLYKQQNEVMSRNLVYLTQSHFKGFDEKTMKGMMQVVDTLYLLTIELNKSKDPSQMLSVCQLYNSGFFDQAFKEKQRMMEQAGLSVPTGIVDANGIKISSKG